MFITTVFNDEIDFHFEVLRLVSKRFVLKHLKYWLTKITIFFYNIN